MLASALVLTVALGVGSNAVVHGFGRGLVPSVFPPAQVERVVSVLGTEEDGSWRAVSRDDYASIRLQARLFEWVGAARESVASVSTDGGTSVLTVAGVSPEVAAFFQLPAQNAVVVGHDIASDVLREHAGGGVSTMAIDGVQVRVSAAAPDGLQGLFWGRPVSVWIEHLDLDEGAHDERTLWVLAKLRRDVSIADVERHVNGDRDRGLRVVPYTGVMPDAALALSRLARPLRMAAAGGLFVACSTILVLLLARASARSRDTALCAALGAPRAHLAREVVADGIVILVCGGLSSALLAWWTIRAVPALLFERDVAELVLSLDPAGTAAAAIACLGIVAACLLVPLFRAPHQQPAAVLRRESSGPGRAASRFGLALVAAQMTVCCVLLTVTGVLLESVSAASRMPGAARLKGAVLATVQSHEAPSPAEMRRSGLAFFRRFEAAARSWPGVVPLAWTAALPGGQPTWQRLRIEPANPPVREAVLDVVPFTPTDLDRIVLPPLAGRFFGGGDTTAACPVAVVSAEAATQVFRGDAIGRVISDDGGREAQIVGVVEMRPDPGRRRTDPVVFVYAEQEGVPHGSSSSASFQVPADPSRAEALLDAHVVSPNYFTALGWPLVAGHVLADDLAEGACRMAVVNEQAAERYFDGDAVGASVIDAAGRRTEIVGVVRASPLRALDHAIEPAIYYPLRQDFRRSMTLLLKAPDVTGPEVERLRRALDDVPGRGPLPTVLQTLDARVRQTALAPIRLATALVGVSAVSMVVLAVAAVASGIHEAARRRRRDLAIRLALGAPWWRILRCIVDEAALAVGVGTSLGVFASLVAVRLLAHVLPGGNPPALWVYVAAPVTLAAASAVAGLVPAAQTLTIRPMDLVRDKADVN